MTTDDVVVEPDDPAASGDGVARDGEAAGELTEAQLEALLFVAERPLSRREIAALAGVDRAAVDERLGDLEVSLAPRGIRLLLSGDRVELATAPEAGALIARYVGADAVRLSPAALETLAIVAYRQPVTKGAIERIRGVDSDYTVRALLHRRLVVEQGPDRVVRVHAADPLDGRLRHGLPVGNDRERLERGRRQPDRIGPDVARDKGAAIGRGRELHAVAIGHEADPTGGQRHLEIAQAGIHGLAVRGGQRRDLAA